MNSSLIPPRQVSIDDAATFVGTTTADIVRYDEAGLLPPRGSDAGERNSFGHDDVVGLLWIDKMVKAGAGSSSVGTIAGKAALLSDVITNRLIGLPEGSLRHADLDALVVTERIFGPLGAAVQASRFIALSTHPDLREKSDKIDAAEEALDDTVAAEDARVALVAADRHAFEVLLAEVMEQSGLDRADEALFDSWDEREAAGGFNDEETDNGIIDGERITNAVDAVAQMPYDFSPARLRCIELTEELAASA